MSGILGAFANAFSWTFPSPNSAVTLILGGLVGWGIRELLSLPGRSARERRQMELMKRAASQALEEDWQRRNPGKPITAPVYEQIAASATVAVHHLTADGIVLQPPQLGSPALWLAERGESEKGSGDSEQRPR